MSAPPAGPGRPKAAGYSGTTLPQKLGLKPGMRVTALAAPAAYRDWLAPLPEGLRFVTAKDTATDLVHLFVTRREDLARDLGTLRAALRPDAVVWVSWPKKASGVATTVTEEVVRDVALPLGFVDVKVCAVTDVWSGLKLVVRKALR